MQVLVLKGEIKISVVADRFIVWAVQLTEERVRQCVFHRDALVGVDSQHFAQ